jgi:ribonuclease P protein component
MLAAKHRLRKKKDISLVLEEGKSSKEGPLVLKTIKNDLDFCRFAFIVSRKVSKKASVRNKIRRKMREAVRKRMKNCQPGFDSLFIALPGKIKKENLREIEGCIEQLLGKNKILDQ